MTSRNVLFFGATGIAGVPILTEVLRNKSAFGRIVVFTSPSGDEKKKALLQSWKSQGAELIEGDIQDEPTILKAFEGIDTIVSALGRTAISLQIPLLQLADRTPTIRRFIPSEFGTDIAHDASSAAEKPHQLKLKVRAALQETTDLDYTYLVTGPYPEASHHMYLSFIDGAKGMPDGIGSWNVAGRKAVIVGDGKGKVGLSALEDLGKFVVRTLTRPSPLTFKTSLKLCSFATTPNAFLAEFEKQTGSKWTVEYFSLEKLRELEKKLWEENSSFKTGATLRRIWAEGGASYEEWDNAILGLGDGDLKSLEEVVTKAIEVQKGYQ